MGFIETIIVSLKSAWDREVAAYNHTKALENLMTPQEARDARGWIWSGAGPSEPGTVFYGSFPPPVSRAELERRMQMQQQTPAHG